MKQAFYNGIFPCRKFLRPFLPEIDPREMEWVPSRPFLLSLSQFWRGGKERAREKNPSWLATPFDVAIHGLPRANILIGWRRPSLLPSNLDGSLYITDRCPDKMSPFHLKPVIFCGILYRNLVAIAIAETFSTFFYFWRFWIQWTS